MATIHDTQVQADPEFENLSPVVIQYINKKLCELEKYEMKANYYKNLSKLILSAVQTGDLSQNTTEKEFASIINHAFSA